MDVHMVCDGHAVSNLIRMWTEDCQWEKRNKDFLFFK